jgi:ABC-type glycerol-3-phosphate transport system substrate-binding protein
MSLYFAQKSQRILSAVLMLFIVGLGTVGTVGTANACNKTKVFTATGTGSTEAEARKDAKRKVKKKIAAYKKKHPGCKVKVRYA